MSKLCENCVVEHCADRNRGQVIFCSSHTTKPIQTHADRIRAMSDEELYLWAKKQIGCGFDFFPCGVVCDGKCESFDDETCKAKIMEWLRQPAEVSGDG